MTKRRRITLLACAVAAISVAGGTAAFAGDNDSGFKTARAPMLTSSHGWRRDRRRSSPSGTCFRAGTGSSRFRTGSPLRTRGQGRVDLFVNHETSKVPFPFNRRRPQRRTDENDFDNAQVSRLILNQHSAGVLNGSFVIPSSGGFQRFCSNYLATAKEGFDRDILFTNEESPDYVLRQEDSWPPAIGDPARAGERGRHRPRRQDRQVARPIYGMGRHNHENDVAIPGYDDRSCSRVTTRSRAAPLTISGRRAACRGTPTSAVTAVLLHRIEHRRALARRG